MKLVESYIYLKSEDLKKSLEKKSFIAYQGQNLLFLKDTYTSDIVLEFLKHVFNNVSKIAVQADSENNYFILDKFKEEVIEPFSKYEYVPDDYLNNLELLASVIISRKV